MRKNSCNFGCSAVCRCVSHKKSPGLRATVVADVDYAKGMAAQYMEMNPDVTINVLQGPESATDRAQQYLQFFEAQSGEVDVYEIDVIWPGDMAEHLVDLGQYEALVTASADFFPAIVEKQHRRRRACSDALLYRCWSTVLPPATC